MSNFQFLYSREKMFLFYLQSVPSYTIGVYDSRALSVFIFMNNLYRLQSICVCRFALTVILLFYS